MEMAGRQASMPKPIFMTIREPGTVEYEMMTPEDHELLSRRAKRHHGKLIEPREFLFDDESRIKCRIVAFTWAFIYPAKQGRRSVMESYKYWNLRYHRLTSIPVGAPILVRIPDDTPASYVKGITEVMKCHYMKLELIVLVLRGDMENRKKIAERGYERSVAQYGVPLVKFRGEDFFDLRQDLSKAMTMLDKMMREYDRSLRGEKICPDLNNLKLGERATVPFVYLDQEKLKDMYAGLLRPPKFYIPYAGYDDHKKVFANFEKPVEKPEFTVPMLRGNREVRIRPPPARRIPPPPPEEPSIFYDELNDPLNFILNPNYIFH